MTTTTRALLLTGATLACSATQAQTADQDASGLQEVVITAQKRPERLADIPVAAAVISSTALANSNSSDISDLNKLVPSVNLNGSFNGRVPMGIRGISSVSNEGTVGLSSGVAIMVDGVPIPSDSTLGNQLEDIQSVEVLKGPQATLGGRTAATGVINIVTRKPSDVFTGDVTLTATNDSEYRVNGFVSGPITNGISFSLAAYGNEREYPIKNLQLDKDTSQKTSGARGKLLLKPNENLDVTLMAHYARMTSDEANFAYTFISPGAAILVGNHVDPTTGSAVPNVPFLSAAALMPNITPSFGNRYYDSPIRGGSQFIDKDASLVMEYRLGELTLGSTTAFQHETQVMVQDLFLVNSYFWNELTGAPGSGTPPFYNSQTVSENINQLSEELKLASPADRPLSYLVGVFYSNTKVREQYNRPLFPAYNVFDVTPKTETTDLYGRATWKFLPQTSLATGLRLNYDSLSYQDFWTQNTLVFPGPTASYPPVIVTNQAASDSHHSSTVVGDISLQQQFERDVMGYATYARGYSPGAFNTVQAIYSDATPTIPSGLTIAQLDTLFPGLVSPANQPKLNYVDKETVDHFEIGLKGTYFERTLRANLALFYTKYRNFQIQNFDLSSKAISPPLILAAAGGAETRGAELDSTWAASSTLRLDFSAAYIDAQFTDYPEAPCFYPYVSGEVAPGCTVVNGTGVQNLKGKPMPNSPKLKFNANIEKRLPLGSMPYELLVAGNYSYRTQAQMLADQNPKTVQPSFGILNLQLGMRESSGRYSVTAYVNNVFDKHYYVDLEDFWSSVWGGTNTVMGQPARDSYRYYGVRLNASF